eukprot:8856612-Pyramimonas_sp.AAC.1
MPARGCLCGRLPRMDDRCLGCKESLPERRQLSGTGGGYRRGLSAMSNSRYPPTSLQFGAK